MIDDDSTTDSDLPGVPVDSVIRDELAKRLNQMFWVGGCDKEDCSCWTAWRDEADHWLRSVRNGSRADVRGSHAWTKAEEVGA